VDAAAVTQDAGSRCGETAQQDLSKSSGNSNLSLFNGLLLPRDQHVFLQKLAFFDDAMS
jgi:hypothetical protein